MWKQIAKKLKSILDANSLLAVTYLYETLEYNGTPYATLVPSGNENEYDTTTENMRVYAFNLRLYMEIGTDADNHSNVEDALMELCDSVLDDLDKNHRLSGLEIRTGYTFLFMDAAPSSWGYIDRENALRVAEISVRVFVDVDVNLIS